MATSSKQGRVLGLGSVAKTLYSSLQNMPVVIQHRSALHVWMKNNRDSFVLQSQVDTYRPLPMTTVLHTAV